MLKKIKKLLNEVILRYRFHHGNKGFARIFFLDFLALRQISFLLCQAFPTQERVIHTQRNPNPQFAYPYGGRIDPNPENKQ